MTTHQIKMLAKLVNQPISHQIIILVVPSVMPVVEQGAKHSTSLPPVVRRVQNARISAQNMHTLVVNGGILGDELFRDFGRDVLDRLYTGALVSMESHKAAEKGNARCELGSRTMAATGSRTTSVASSESAASACAGPKNLIATCESSYSSSNE